MGLFQDISSEAQRRELKFIVIGGLAVVIHGYSRDTADLDLLVRRNDRGAWLAMLSDLGYTLFQERENFIQLAPPKQGAWPVDLMLVQDSTFFPMVESAMTSDMYGARVKIPTLDHLLALKLHALKHGHIGRYTKDLLDVEALVRVNALDMKSERMKQLFTKYGTMKLYEQVSRFSAGEK